jgi:hypothetical protein
LGIAIPKASTPYEAFDKLRVCAVRDVPAGKHVRRESRSVSLASMHRLIVGRGGRFQVDPVAIREIDTRFAPAGRTPQWRFAGKTGLVDIDRAAMIELDTEPSDDRRYGDRVAIYADGEPYCRMPARAVRLLVADGQMVPAGTVLAGSANERIRDFGLELFGGWTEKGGDYAHPDRDFEFAEGAFLVDGVLCHEAAGEAVGTDTVSLRLYQSFGETTLSEVFLRTGWHPTPAYTQAFVAWMTEGAPIASDQTGIFTGFRPVEGTTLARPHFVAQGESLDAPGWYGRALPPLERLAVAPGEFVGEGYTLAYGVEAKAYTVDEAEKAIAAQRVLWHSLGLQQQAKRHDGRWLLPTGYVPKVHQHLGTVVVDTSEFAEVGHDLGDWWVITHELGAWDDLTGRFLGEEVWCDFRPAARRLVGTPAPVPKPAKGKGKRRRSRGRRPQVVDWKPEMVPAG